MLDLPDAGLMHKLSPLEQVGAVVILFQQVEERLIELIVLSWKHNPAASPPIKAPPPDRRRWSAKQKFTCLVAKARVKTQDHRRDPQWQFLFGNLGSLDRLADARNSWIHSHYDLGRVFARSGSDGLVMKRTTVDTVTFPSAKPEEGLITATMLYARETSLSDGSTFEQFRRDQENSMHALSHLIDLYSH